MITFREGLFISYSATDDYKKIIKNIKAGKLLLDVYVITLAACRSDVFDIIPAFMLNSDFYKQRDIRILGISLGRRDAFHLAGTMVSKVIERTGGMDIRGYFSDGETEKDTKESENYFLEPEYDQMEVCPEEDFEENEQYTGRKGRASRGLYGNQDDFHSAEVKG